MFVSKSVPSFDAPSQFLNLFSLFRSNSKPHGDNHVAFR